MEKAEISTWEGYDAGKNAYVKLTEYWNCVGSTVTRQVYAEDEREILVISQYLLVLAEGRYLKHFWLAASHKSYNCRKLFQ